MAVSCPNKASQDWKDLVEEVGEKKAYQAFIENNFEIPYSWKTTNEPAINEAVNKFLNTIGVTVQQVKEITSRNGEVIAANAMADLLYKTIQVVEGKSKIDTLPEEASHFLVAMLRESTLYKSMFNDIQNYEIYKEVVKEYNSQYNGDVTKLKEEAMAKVITSLIVNNFSDSKLETRANSWWNRVITYLRELFSKANKEELYNTIQYAAPFSEAANLIINDSINRRYYPSSENEGEFYQLEEQTQDVIKDALTSNLNRGSISLEGDKYVLTKNDGTKKNIVRRVSDRVKELTKNYTERTPLEKQSDAIRGTYGTKGHNDIQNVFERHIALEEGTIVPAKTEYLGSTMYTVLEKFAQSYIKSFPVGTKFLVEQKVYDEKADEAGTIDLIAIYPDGRVDITDWKFQEFKSKNKAIPNWKKNNWNVQLGRYSEMLSKVYGIRNIQRKRVIPIEATYDNNVLTKIKVGATEIKNFTKTTEHLKPVPISSEMTGIESLDKLIEDLLRQKESLSKEKAPATTDDAKRQAFYEGRKLRLMEIEKAIEGIQLTNDIHGYVSKATKEIKDIESTGIENLTEGELAEAIKMTEFYGQRLVLVLGSLVKKQTEAYQKELAYLVTKSQGLIGELQNENLRRGKKNYGNSINEAQRGGGFWERQMRTLSQQNHPVLKAFYQLVVKSKEKTRKELNTLREQIEKATRELEKYQTSKGISTRDMFNFMLDKTGKTVRLSAKYNPKYYEQRDININKLSNGTKAEQAEALAWFRDNTIYDEERYDKSYEAHKAQSEKFYKHYDNPREAVKKAMLDYQNKYGDNANGYKNKNNFYVRPKDDFFSDSYKEIQANEPLRNFYNLFTENTKMYREVIGQKFDARFIWNVKKDFIESIAENGIEAMGDMSFINDAFKLQTGVRDGNVDVQTGEEQHSIPTYMLQGVETKDQSTDLGRILYLAGSMAYNYKHMAEIEDATKSLEIILRGSEEILTNNNGEDLANKVTGRLQKIIGSSDTISQYKDYVNYYVYGIKNTTKDFKVKIGNTEYSALAAYGFINKMFIGKSLAGNPISIIANSVGGDWNARILGAGGRFYSRKNYNSALKELGTRDEKAYSIVGFFDLIDGENNWAKSSDLSVHSLTKHVTYEKLFLGQKVGDYAIRNSVGIAMLKSHTVENGKIVKMTEGKKEQKSLYDTLEVKDKKLTNTDIVSEDVLNQFRRKILKVTEDILGNNSRDDIRLASLTILGRALMAFRSWIPRTVDARYGELRYSEDIEAYELGRYRSFWNQIVTKQFLPLIVDMIKDFGTFGLTDYGNATIDRAKQLYREAIIKNPQLTLSEQEFIDIHIANLRANMAELRIVGGALTMLLAVKPSPDEDKDDIGAARKYIVRQMDRNMSELLFYYNVTEFNRILKSPIPITRALTDVYSLFRDVSKETFGAVTGNEKMQYEARPIKYSLKIFPLLNGIESAISMVDEDYDREKSATFSSKNR